MKTSRKIENNISHNINSENLISRVNSIKEKIALSANEYVSLERQYEIVDELLGFALGRFLIANQGLDGYWTDYILNYPLREKISNNYCIHEYKVSSNIENFILTEAPGVLASQERYLKFLQYNQQKVTEGAKLASIPSGILGELLPLNYSNIKDINLFAIDIDPKSLDYAKKITQNMGFKHKMNTYQCDAWKLSMDDEFDLISSSGLNIYEPNDNRIQELYEVFYRCLRKDGQLVTSFLTFPPKYKSESEWNTKEINFKSMLMQKIIFSDLIEMKWECFRTSAKIISLLESVGFTNIKIDYDKFKIFPTVIAYK